MTKRVACGADRGFAYEQRHALATISHKQRLTAYRAISRSPVVPELTLIGRSGPDRTTRTYMTQSAFAYENTDFWYVLEIRRAATQKRYTVDLYVVSPECFGGAAHGPIKDQVKRVLKAGGGALISTFHNPLISESLAIGKQQIALAQILFKETMDKRNSSGRSHWDYVRGRGFLHRPVIS